MLPSNYCDPTPPTRAVPPTALVLRMDDVSVPFPYDREVHNISIVNDEAEGRNRDGLFSSSSAPSPHKLSSIDDTCTPCIKISPDSFCIGESDVTIGQQLMKNNSVAKERTIIERSFEAKEGGGSEPFAELTSTSFPFDHYGSPANSASFGTTQRGSITLCFPPKALIRRPSTCTPASTASDDLVDLYPHTHIKQGDDVFIGLHIDEDKKDTHHHHSCLDTHTTTAASTAGEGNWRDNFRREVNGGGDAGAVAEEEQKQQGGPQSDDGNNGAFESVRVDALNNVDCFHGDEDIAERSSSLFFRPHPLFVEYKLPRHYRPEDIACITAKVSLACTAKREQKGGRFGAPNEEQESEEEGRERERANMYCSNERRDSYSSSSYSAVTAFLGADESVMGITSERCLDDCEENKTYELK